MQSYYFLSDSYLRYLSNHLSKMCSYLIAYIYKILQWNIIFNNKGFIIWCNHSQKEKLEK